MMWIAQAIPLVIQAGFMNSGQACVAGTRILVPHRRRSKPRWRRPWRR
jgi:aldehyde dehydrogenase (NAD+)